MSQSTFNAAMQNAGFNDETTRISKVNLKSVFETLGTDLYKSGATSFIVDSDEALSAWLNNTGGNNYSHILIRRGEWAYSGTPLSLSAIGTKTIIGESGSVINASTNGMVLYIRQHTNISGLLR